MRTVQVRLLPVQAPPQVRNRACAAGFAVRTMLAPISGRSTQAFLGPRPVHVPRADATLPRPATVIVSAAVFPPLNVAETSCGPLIVTVQVVAVPLQAPPQPENVAPDAGSSASVTVVLMARLTLHVVAPSPQSIPPPVTRPRPLTATVSEALVACANEAETVRAAVIVTVHVDAVPLQAPPQPLNTAPLAGVAVNVTLELRASLDVHVDPPLPQEIPPPVTVPGPLTDTVSVVAFVVNVAVTLLASLIRIVQVVDEPPQAPLQPANAAPVTGTAVSVTVVPGAKPAEQMVASAPQLIAPDPPLTFPGPFTETARLTAGSNFAETDLSSSISTEHMGAVPEHSPVQPVNT
jgi:hypothetical protein